MKELRKKALILSLSGFLLGFLIGIAFLVIPDDGTLKNEGIVGKILYLMTCGIYGALAWGSSVIYEIESWSILRCTVTHGLITFGGLTVFFGVLVVAGWMKKPSLGAALIMLIMFLLVYFLIWLIQFMIYRRKVKKMNLKLREWKGIRKD